MAQSIDRNESMKEADFKLLFKKSVAHYGGIAISLNSSFYTGLCDLYMSTTHYHLPILIEAKFLYKIVPGFKRKIKYSEIQRHTLDKCNKIRPGSALGLVGYRDGHTTVACLVNASIKTLTEDTPCGRAVSSRGSFFDIPTMFKSFTESERQTKLNGLDLDQLMMEIEVDCEHANQISD